MWFEIYTWSKLKENGAGCWMFTIRFTKGLFLVRHLICVLLSLNKKVLVLNYKEQHSP